MRVLTIMVAIGIGWGTQASAQAPDPMLLPEGATVYSEFCASCHVARASSERTDLEWVPIVLHMRARANFTKREAAAVLAFLQATNLPETASPLGGGDASALNIVLPDQLREELVGRGEEGRTNEEANTRRPGGRP